MIPGILSLDIGTSSIRVTIYTKQDGIVGKWVKQQQINSRFSIELIWNAVTKLIRMGIKDNPEIKIESIGVSAFLGWIIVDKNGRPLDKAWNWMAIGSQEEMDLYSKKLPKNTQDVIGRKINRSLGVFLWGRTVRNISDNIKILSIKDYINYKFTGIMKMDKAHASYTGLFSVKNRNWNICLFNAFGIPINAVPSLGEGTDKVGDILPNIAMELGLPNTVSVALCGPDGTLAILGGGGTVVGKTIEVMGTTDVIYHVSDQYLDKDIVRKGIIQNCHVIPNLYTVGGPTGMTGGTLSWLMKEWNWTFDSEEYLDMLAKWKEINPVQEGLFVIPSLTGTRTPEWNPLMRGTIVGLQPHHKLADIYKATLQGISYGTRKIIEHLNNYVDIGENLVAIGGGSREKIFLETRASILEVKIQIPKISEASSIGAIALAGVLEKWFTDVETAISEINPIQEEIKVLDKQTNENNFYENYNYLLTIMSDWYTRRRQRIE